MTKEITKDDMLGYLAVMMSWVPLDHQKESIYQAIYDRLGEKPAQRKVSREEVSAKVLYYYVDPERAKRPINKEAIAEVDCFIAWLRDLGLEIEPEGK
jgi:hypothetical protein